MMFGFNMGVGKHEFLINTLIFISKWSIWKTRNKIKYDKIHIYPNIICSIIWKLTFISELKSLLKADCNDIIDHFRILTIHPWLLISYNIWVQIHVQSNLALAVTSIKQSPVLKGHLFLSCHRTFHMNWTSFKRPPVLYDHFSFFPSVTS